MKKVIEYNITGLTHEGAVAAIENIDSIWERYKENTKDEDFEGKCHTKEELIKNYEKYLTTNNREKRRKGFI